MKIITETNKNEAKQIIENRINEFLINQGANLNLTDKNDINMEIKPGSFEYPKTQPEISLESIQSIRNKSINNKNGDKLDKKIKP
jgi:hypothetical protein